MISVWRCLVDNIFYTFFYRKLEYTRDTLLAFKKEMEIKEKEAKGGGGSFGGFGGFGNTDTAKDKVAILSIYLQLL